MSTTAKAIRVKGDAASAQYKIYRTSPTENCVELAAVRAGQAVTVPAQGMVTLVGIK